MNEQEIFAHVIDESDAGKRAELLAELAGDDHGLRDRVQKLIDAADSPESFFADPVKAAANRDLDETYVGIAQAGTTIGPYKLLQQIGEGGMGLVFMAEQTEPVKRRVALKIIKPGMDSKQVIARFEAERQALAMMDHPNIAKVLDAGSTDQGYPYFVMELVNGLPITEYCDQEKLSTDKRLGIFADVCRAVQHAHHKGVIHRDLKPNNILVAEYDGRPVPKVIDFGVAKATGVQLTEKTLFTSFGQVVGTIEYMSPEQSRRNQLDVDTRSDVYSLGVVLYKLLTGETPFGPDRLKQAALDEMLKIIREEPIPRPSERIGSSQSLEQIAVDRSIDPKRLTSQVEGDLDWIVLKTLEKDRNHRYASAGELADDVKRHLDQHPIAARPSSSLDRFRKYARRNPKRVQTFALLFAGLVGLGFLGMQAANELKARTTQLVRTNNAAQEALIRAESTPVTDRKSWEAAKTQARLVEQYLEEWKSDGEVEAKSREILRRFDEQYSRWQLAVQIEETLIADAPKDDLASWQKMEKKMRAFFRKNGFDLDNDDPAEIGKRISQHKNSEQWADLLELWIGTVSQMGTMGGPKTTMEQMQPWAEAIYIADTDPIRTGIRKFMYTPPRSREGLAFAEDLDLTTVSARTIAWLGHCWAMVGAHDKCDDVFEQGIRLHPNNVMLTHDYAFALSLQKRHNEAARMYHRCLALRPNSPALWDALARTLEANGETEAAARAIATANKHAAE